MSEILLVFLIASAFGTKGLILFFVLKALQEQERP